MAKDQSEWTYKDQSEVLEDAMDKAIKTGDLLTIVKAYQARDRWLRRIIINFEVRATAPVKQSVNADMLSLKEDDEEETASLITPTT